MITDDIISILRYKGEGNDLDFKAERYPFEGATDDQKSELLKDILAFANAFRDGTAYILMGFAEASPLPAEVCGVPSGGAIDDSRLQQFVNGKVDKPLELRYEERMFEGKHIAVLAIPKQARPFFSVKDYGKVRKDAVYVRRGSATALANPQEIAAMVKADTFKSTPSVSLSISDDKNDPLGHDFDRRFLQFAKPLPDYERHYGPLEMAIDRANRDYWRELADYCIEHARTIPIRLSLSNESGFSLGNAKLEVTCHPADHVGVRMIRADDAAEYPRKTYWPGVPSMRSAIEQASSQMKVDDVGIFPVAHIGLGTLRPGETTRAEDDLVVLPSLPGKYLLKVRVLADEIGTPINYDHLLEVSGDVLNLDFDSFMELLKPASQKSNG